jgi:hypothetical protein
MIRVTSECGYSPVWSRSSTRQGSNEIAIASRRRGVTQVLRPRRLAVHLDPGDEAEGVALADIASSAPPRNARLMTTWEYLIVSLPKFHEVRAEQGSRHQSPCSMSRFAWLGSRRAHGDG